MVPSSRVANNECQRELHPDLIPPQADIVCGIARECGALGWKVNGAGGPGGSMAILSSQDGEERIGMISAINNLGGGIRCLPAELSAEGLEVIESKEDE